MSKDAQASEEGREWREAVPNDRLAHLVKDLLRAMTRSLQIRLMDHSVSYGYWPYLRVLWERDDITQRELSELVGLSEPTTHTALQSMERLGYVRKRKHPDNLRKLYIVLTPRGRALKAKLIPLAEELNAVAIRGIPKRDIEVFRRTVHAMLENLHQDEMDLDRTLPPLRKMT